MIFISEYWLSMKQKIKNVIFNNSVLCSLQSKAVRVIRNIPGICYINGIMDIKNVLNIQSKINREFSEKFIVNGTIPIEDGLFDNFKKSFKKHLWAQPNRGEISKLFIEADIRLKNKSFDKQKLDDKDVVVICIVKNDLLRMKIFMDHYRNMSVKKFVIIDNMSDDGTYEFLKEQPDVNLYVCKTPYSTVKREAWVNRIIAYYGINRWYLCVDSDELFVYPNMENINIKEFISQQKTKRIRSIMLDMYSNEGIWKKNHIDKDDIRRKYCYFDSDSYKERANIKFELIVGGPRTRVFSKNKNEFTGIMVKHPLFYFQKGDIQAHSHYQFPYKYNFNIECKTALLHYKFLPNDLNKYKQEYESGNYANGSKEYKIYISSYNENPNETFMYEGSKEFKDSSTLSLIDINANMKK